MGEIAKFSREQAAADREKTMLLLKQADRKAQADALTKWRVSEANNKAAMGRQVVNTGGTSVTKLIEKWLMASQTRQAEAQERITIPAAPINGGGVAAQQGAQRPTSDVSGPVTGVDPALVAEYRSKRLQIDDILNRMPPTTRGAYAKARTRGGSYWNYLEEADTKRAGLQADSAALIQAEHGMKGKEKSESRLERRLSHDIGKQKQVVDAFRAAQLRNEGDDVVEVLGLISDGATDEPMVIYEFSKLVMAATKKKGSPLTRIELMGLVDKVPEKYRKPDPANVTPSWGKVADSESDTGYSWVDRNSPTTRVKGAPKPSSDDKTIRYTTKDGDVFEILTGAQPGKEGADTLQVEREVLQVVNDGFSIVNNITDADIGAAGWIGRKMGAFKAQISALAGQFGGVDASEIKQYTDNWDTAWGEHSAAMKAEITHFAYALITSLQGSRPSNEDINNAMIMIGNSGSAKLMQASIKRLMAIHLRKYETRRRQLPGHEDFDVGNWIAERGVFLPGLNLPPENAKGIPTRENINELMAFMLSDAPNTEKAAAMDSFDGVFWLGSGMQFMQKPRANKKKKK